MKTMPIFKLLNPIIWVAGLLYGGAVLAADISQAKSAGWVCEQVDGYARVAKPNAPADVQAMVNSVNNQRRAEYQRIGQKNGVAVEQVARLTAQKVIGAAPQFRCK